MGINPDALFSDLQQDLEAYLQSEDALSKAAAQSLLNSFYKKFVAREEKDAEQRALDKFITINDRCKNFEVPVLSEEQSIFFGTLQRVLEKWYVRSPLGSLSFGSILDHGRVGPGASLKARGDDFYTKLFDSPLSCTKAGLFTVYKQYIGASPRWESAENLRQSTYGAALVVEGNTLSFVPKTNAIKRTICTEPTLNMMYQLGLGFWIEDCLRRETGIDLGIQPEKNRELARIGSISGSFGTIDLESASDSLALKMLERVLPRGLLSWLTLFRSPVSRIRGKQVELQMVSTMGNGFTFPLQTLLFAAVVVATAICEGFTLVYPRGNRLGNFGVFGDDIIVRSPLYAKVVSNLELLGFVVNRSKSFNEGPFRESCGHDYYNGQNIRGVYVKSLTSVQDRFVLLNRLLDFTARTGIPVSNVFRALRRTVPDLPVPLAENDDAGLRTPYTFLRRRIRDRDCQSIRYKRWVAKSFTIDVVDKDGGYIRVPKGEKRRSFNYDGLLIAFLRGGLIEHRSAIRLDRTRYSIRTGISPNWDMIPMGLGEIAPRVGLAALETSFLLNSLEE